MKVTVEANYLKKADLWKGIAISLVIVATVVSVVALGVAWY